MYNIDLTALLFSFVGRTFIRDGREVQVLSLIPGPDEAAFLCVWKDTCMVYTATLYEVAMEFEKEQ